MGSDLLDQAATQEFEIFKLGHPALRLRSEEVNPSEIGSEKINNILVRLKQTKQTVGLSAPQLGINYRIFLTELPTRLSSRYLGYTPSPLQIWINPSYTVVDDTMLGGCESCLSVPGYIGRVLRPAAIEVQALNEDGKSVIETLSGWNARVFLHEYDHLDGILYVDKLAEDPEGRKELFEKSMWEVIEAEKRKAGDAEWLARFRLKQ
ncbi:MAG: peptide deformylase [Desulforudis sp.]|jgi:peptide deformylase|nr:MAG: peptide deformylase [Desulforudis sp.]